MEGGEDLRGKGRKRRALGLDTVQIVVIFGVQVWGRLRAGMEEGLGQDFMAGGEELGFGGQEAILALPLGGGHKAVDRIRIPGRLHFTEIADQAVFHPGAFEDLVDVICGLGFGRGNLNLGQGLVELEEIALAQVVVQAPSGLGDFFLEMFLMPVQGRGAGPVLPAEGFKSAVTGQEGLVNGLEVGVGADGAFHKTVFRFQFSVFG